MITNLDTSVIISVINLHLFAIALICAMRKLYFIYNDSILEFRRIGGVLSLQNNFNFSFFNSHLLSGIFLERLIRHSIGRHSRRVERSEWNCRVDLVDGGLRTDHGCRQHRGRGRRGDHCGGDHRRTADCGCAAIWKSRNQLLIIFGAFLCLE